MKILPASTGDVHDLARIHIEGWRASYGGLVDQSFLDSLNAEKRAQEWAAWMESGTEVLIARDDDNNAAGFIAFGKLMTAPPGMSSVRPLYTSEILAIYILPEYWRNGLGRKLMGEAAVRLMEKKHRSLCLWVLEKNTRGNAFYKALGGERCGKKQVEIGGRKLTDVCYGWRNIAAVLPLS
jgi:ribosomal protein S18 acetylase RimI-like enzyme